MRNEVQDGHPCESCTRWTECNGVDWPTCQAEITDTLEQIIAAVYQIVKDVYPVQAWAIKNRPRLVHLAGYAKKRKDRRKNLRRIIREFCEED